MKCQRCNSNRILCVKSQCFHRFYGCFANTGETIGGYVPGGFGIGEDSSDRVEFDLCLNCGQIQGDFPVFGQIVENEQNKMTPQRILEIYEDLLKRYKEYIVGKNVDYPYEELPGEIIVHLPPIHGKADDREKFKGEFEPDHLYKVTVIATVNCSDWGLPVHVLDKATDKDIRVLVSQMLFPEGNQADDFLTSQEF